MALSYMSEGEAPRDFRVSSTESDGHYTKCLLCYTVKRNFYCPDCIKTGAFVPSSMPYSDRYSEKQAKLMRLKANRKHVLDRCEKLLLGKIKRDNLLIEAKQSRDKLDLIRLAIEQRRSNIDEKKKVLDELVEYNQELTSRLPRYHKRVALLISHVRGRKIVLQENMSSFTDQSDALAALRRSRIRQLTKYIFPVYISYDTSDSIEDMEFVGDFEEDELPRKDQLHIVSPWMNTDGDFSHVQAWLAQNREAIVAGGGPGGATGAEGAGSGVAAGAGAAHPLRRAQAALALAAQLVALLAWHLDLRLPHAIALSEYCSWRCNGSGLTSAARRLERACAALAARGALPPPPRPRALAALPLIAAAAAADEPSLGRVEAWGSECGRWAREEREPDECEPEHLCWPDALDTKDQMEELSCTPPTPAASLVTSAASSLASLWRGWTK